MDMNISFRSDAGDWRSAILRFAMQFISLFPAFAPLSSHFFFIEEEVPCVLYRCVLGSASHLVILDTGIALQGFCCQVRTVGRCPGEGSCKCACVSYACTLASLLETCWSLDQCAYRVFCACYERKFLPGVAGFLRRADILLCKRIQYSLGAAWIRSGGSLMPVRRVCDNGMQVPL